MVEEKNNTVGSLPIYLGCATLTPCGGMQYIMCSLVGTYRSVVGTIVTYFFVFFFSSFLYSNMGKSLMLRSFSMRGDPRYEVFTIIPINIVNSISICKIYQIPNKLALPCTAKEMF